MNFIIYTDIKQSIFMRQGEREHAYWGLNELISFSSVAGSNDKYNISGKWKFIATQ